MAWPCLLRPSLPTSDGKARRARNSTNPGQVLLGLYRHPLTTVIRQVVVLQHPPRALEHNFLAGGVVGSLPQGPILSKPGMIREQLESIRCTNGLPVARKKPARNLLLQWLDELRPKCRNFTRYSRRNRFPHRCHFVGSRNALHTRFLANSGLYKGQDQWDLHRSMQRGVKNHRTFRIPEFLQACLVWISVSRDKAGGIRSRAWLPRKPLLVARWSVQRSARAAERCGCDSRSDVEMSWNEYVFGRTGRVRLPVESIATKE
jgi:hypothetical protein